MWSNVSYLSKLKSYKNTIIKSKLREVPFEVYWIHTQICELVVTDHNDLG